jgi:hypothetical protein
LPFWWWPEALIRLIIESLDFKGIDIETINHRIAQFADDTTIFAKDYNDANHIWPILDLYKSATGMRGNAGKFLGIQMGSRKRKKPPDNFGPPGFNIELLAEGKFGKLLGVPFWKNAGKKTPFEGASTVK